MSYILSETLINITNHINLQQEDDFMLTLLIKGQAKKIFILN